MSEQQDKKCLVCGWLITFPPFGLGECSIHETPHKQKEYCADWALLKREDAYCKPGCSLDGRLVRERPSEKITAFPEMKEIRTFPIGRAVKRELDVSENVPGAPLYFITEKSTHKVSVTILNPLTRTRISDEVIASMRVCAA